MFVSNEPVPVTDGLNTIWIVAKMSVGIRNKIIGTATKMSTVPGTNEADVNVDMGAYQTAQLVHCIVRWDGPDFDGVPCTPEFIERLDPDEPLVDAVLEEIATRNPIKPTAPNGSPPTIESAANGSKPYKGRATKRPVG